MQELLLSFTSGKRKNVLLVLLFVLLLWIFKRPNCAHSIGRSFERYKEEDTGEDNLPLNRYNHWQIDEDKWDTLVFKNSLPIGIRDGDHVFESGCGAGAFLKSLQKFYSITISGVDFSETQGEKELEGTFYVADVRNLNQTKSESVDHAISYGVFYYLENEENAEMALKEMLRITKSSGTLYIGDVDNPVQLFRETHNGCWGEGGYYIDKEWWIKMAKKHNFFLLPFVDEKDTVMSEWPNSRWRYSVYIKKIPNKNVPPNCYGSEKIACIYNE